MDLAQNNFPVSETVYTQDQSSFPISSREGCQKIAGG